MHSLSVDAWSLGAKVGASRRSLIAGGNSRHSFSVEEALEKVIGTSLRWLH